MFAFLLGPLGSRLGIGCELDLRVLLGSDGLVLGLSLHLSEGLQLGKLGLLLRLGLHQVSLHTLRFLFLLV